LSPTLIFALSAAIATACRSPATEAATFAFSDPPSFVRTSG
jgi:hypothetical protein